MPIILWDASSLVKRYYPESGSSTVDAIFGLVPPSQMQATVWGYAETFAILHRKRNNGILSGSAFNRAATKLQNEVLTARDFGLLSIEDDRVLAGLAYVTRHNLNSNEAAILATYLRYKRSLPPECIPNCCLQTTSPSFLTIWANGKATWYTEQKRIRRRTP